MKLLVAMATLAMMGDKKKMPKVRCEICSLLIDDPRFRFEVKAGWVCSVSCLTLYERRQETQRLNDKKLRDKEIQANMKKFGKGFK